MHHFLVKMQDHVFCFMQKIVQTHSKNQLTQTDFAEMNFLI